MAPGLSILNPEPKKLPGPSLLHDLVSQQGRDGSAAIQYLDRLGQVVAIDYAALHQRTNRLANLLSERAKNPRPQNRRLIIPVFIEQSPHLYISQLAILKTGGAFCPLAQDIPEERLRFILQDVGATCLLTTSSSHRSLPALDGVDVIIVDSLAEDGDSSAVCVPVAPENAAYVMYTSGSTGQPKGVILSHSAVTQALLAHDRHIPHFSRFLQFASPTFDVSVFEVFFPLFRGRTLACCDRKQLLNDLPAVMNRLQVDAAELTPSVANSLLRSRQNVPSLRVLLTIGEMLRPAVVEEFGGTSESPGVLHGMYGPTEATIHCTLQLDFPKRMSCATIGVPLDTVSAFVLRPVGRDEPPGIEILPTGHEGELALGGLQLADGYLNRDEQTKLAFVQHPQYGRLYRTGDLAKLLPNGSLECLGRISGGQVKLRGQRIELGEIEYAVSKTVGIQDVVVEAVSGTLVAFCVPLDTRVTADLVRDTCRRWLPAFMVPGDVSFCRSLPYLPSGKLDRKGLRENYAASGHVGSSETESSPHMSRILACLQKVLGVDIAFSSALPHFGLDSLSSIRVAAELRSAGFVRLDATHVLAAQTPVDLARKIEELETNTPSFIADVKCKEEFQEYRRAVLTDCRLTHLLDDIDDVFPCTVMQAAMLVETSKDPQAYCNWFEVQVAGLEDPQSVKRALVTLSQNHQMLRSGFMVVHQRRSTHANLVWKSLKPHQIRVTDDFDYEFRVGDDTGLLHPCEIQLRADGNDCRVLFKLHHALFDQWSIDILCSDLAKALGSEPVTAATQFRDVSQYHYEHFDEAHGQANLDFWQDYLRNVVPTTLPQLRGQSVRPRLQHTQWIDLDLEMQLLKSVSQLLGLSGPAVLQTALLYLMSRYVGKTDITIGSVFSGRHIAVPDIEKVIGPCLQTLPLRMDISTAHTCHELMSAVTHLNRSMQKHSLTSPTAIKQASGVSPGVALFDTLFVWQETSLTKRSSGNSVRLADSADHLEFDLIMEFEPSSAAVRARATFQQRLISADQVNMMFSQLAQIAKYMLSAPESPIDEITSSLDSQTLSISNHIPQSLTQGSVFIRALESRAKSCPSQVAIIYATDPNIEYKKCLSLTYGQLDRQANQVANALISLGLRPGDLICICMEKSIDLYVTILASLKAGAGYLPLVPETPPRRIQAIIQQADIKICACDIESAQTFQSLTSNTIVDMTRMDLRPFQDCRPDVPQSTSRVAYAVFTSGSTGIPKGVAVTLENLHENLAVLAELYKVQPGDRILQACSPAFDVSVFEIFFAFYTGMCLCTASKDHLFRDFEHSIRSMRITHLSLTPTVAALVNPTNVPDVKFLVTAGEGVTEKVHRTWAGHGLHQGYGPSETTNICTLNMNMARDDLLGNIGRPFRNTSAFVVAVGNDFEILPCGAFGEFAFGGNQVFRGYMALDRLNAEKIIHHPTYGRVYRSGDMGRMLSDGTLLIAGRLDDQIKIRGNRVELGDINAVILRNVTVVDCSTVLIGERTTDQMLASFWVPRTEDQKQISTCTFVADGLPSVSELFEDLESSLPAYMIPTAAVPISELPLTLQGKLDKRRLIAIFDALDQPSRCAVSRASSGEFSQDAPASETEQHISNVLAQILDIRSASVSRDASFFALGLNSLNAISFTKSLQMQLTSARDLNVTIVLRNPSVARLSCALSKNLERAPAHPPIEIKNVFPTDFVRDVEAKFAAHGHHVESILPCTPLQEAMLSTSVDMGANAYCNSTTLQIVGDKQKLLHCWSRVVKRHAILRTQFQETDLASRPWAQIILRKAPLSADPLQSHDQENGDLGSHVYNETDSQWISPQQPLHVRVHGSTMTLSMHHAIYDGISMSNLLAEVEALYDGVRLPAPVSFEPFLEEVLTQSGEKALQFWRQKISGFSPHPLPVMRNPNDAWKAVEEHSLRIIPPDLQKFCERNSVTPLSVFQTAWVKTLACAHDLKDVCFGTVVSGRTVSVPNVDHLVAPCFNTIPVRSELHTVRKNLDLTKSLHQNNVECLEWQLTPLRRVQAVSTEPSLHLFDSLILLQPTQRDLNRDLWVLANEEGTMEFPLIVEVIPAGERFCLRLHSSQQMLSGALLKNLARAFDAALGSSVRFASSKLSHFLDFESRLILGKLTPANRVPATSDQVTQEIDRDWTPEQTLIREALANLAEIPVGRIHKTTSLFQIGLDSLNAIQIASQLHKRGFRVDAADVMQNPSPFSLSEILTKNCPASDDDEGTTDLQSFEAEHKPRLLGRGLASWRPHAIRPCTPAQSGMLAQSVQSNGKLYVNHLTYSIPTQSGEDEVNRAWSEVARKHPILRMGFREVEDKTYPFASILYPPDCVLDHHFIYLPDSRNGISQDSITENIMEDMTIPPWRIALSDRESERTMCISIHHALYDAASLRLLLADFSKAMHAGQLGPSYNIDPIIVHVLNGMRRRRKEAEDFWSESLRDSRLTKFPNLSPTVVNQGTLQAIRSTLSIPLVKLEESCRANSTTVQVIGQTAWAILLSAYLDEAQVRFGTVFAGDLPTAIQKAAFPSFSTVPVVCDTKKAVTTVFQDMLSFNTSAQRYRHTALSDIQAYAGSPGQPLFDTVFVYQKTSGEIGAFEWTLIKESAAVDYVLSMEMETTGSQICLQLTFDDHLVPREHALLIIGQYETILRHLVDGTQDQQDFAQNLLSTLPPECPELPAPVSLLHEFVELTARQHPNKPALEFIHSFQYGEKSSETWTYAEFDGRGNQVAHLIHRRGIRPGSIVAVCMSKSAEASSIFVGILKAGCAFLAMDPDLPLARRAFILEDSSAQLLFVDPGETSDDLAIQQVESSPDTLTTPPTFSLDAEPIDASATCYVLYTSGTTGNPKGCEITHDNAVQAMMSFQRLFASHWSQESRWLQFASYWFDVSVLEQFWSWSVGITLVGAPRDIVLSDLAGFIQAADITHLDLTPSLARLLKPQEVPSLCKGVFITGGEALKQDIIDTWGVEGVVCNGYGPTEATIGVTMNTFVGPDAKPTNIGRQFANVGSYVLSPGTDNPVIRGGIGELCVSGRLVGKGYLNRPDLTNKAFPVVDHLNERIYRTGDLVRMLADGSFSFIGRMDTQTKLRGQRLEIEEIDTVIASSHSEGLEVSSLVVKGRGSRGETLISFIVDAMAGNTNLHSGPKSHAQGLIRTAMEACHHRLPGYMVPTHIIPISRLPLTVNNKIDTKKLVEIYLSMTPTELQQLKGSDTRNRATNITEQKVAKTLGRLLSIQESEIRADSNIFTLGLSSISAVSLVSMLRADGFSRASIAAVMRNETIGRLALALAEDLPDQDCEEAAVRQAKLSMAAFARKHRRTVAHSLSMSVSEIEYLSPCTPLQQGLLTESLKGHHQKHYFNSFCYDLIDIDLDRVWNALQTTVRVNPILRTVFVRTEEGFVQVSVQRLPAMHKIPLPVGKIREIAIEMKRKWLSTTEQDVLRPFEVLLLCAPGQNVVIFHAHHAIYDGISWDLFMEQLIRVYHEESVVQPSPCFFDALPYGPLMEHPNAEAFWTKYMEGTQYIPLPAALSTISSSNPIAVRELASISKLESVRRDLGLSYQALFQASFSIALLQFASEIRTYGVVLSGRSIRLGGADCIVGPMFNTVPYPVTIHEHDTWSKYLQRCQELNVQVLPHQHTPLRSIRKFCGRRPADPMFDVIFVFQHRTTKKSQRQGEIFHLWESTDEPDYPLAFEVELVDSESVVITAVAQKNRVDQATLEQLVFDFEKALDHIILDKHSTLVPAFSIDTRVYQQGGDLRGHHVDESKQTDGFVWTNDARMLQKCIAQVAECDVETVTAHTTIFALGLDSIDTVKLASRMKQGGLAISVSRILQAQTIARMLEDITAIEPSDARSEQTATLPSYELKLQSLLSTHRCDVEVERLLPATPGQEGLLAAMLRSGFEQYYNHDILLINNNTDLQNLQSAWQMVIDASPILRTSFVEVQSTDIDVTFAQVVYKPHPIRMEKISIASLDHLDIHLKEVKKDVMLSFRSRPSMRLTFATTPSDRYLILSMAHAQYDGHSLSLLHEDVQQAYCGSLKARPGYDRVIETALPGSDDQALSFWRASLIGVSTSYVGTSAKESIKTGSETHRAERACAISTGAAKTFCQKHGISMQALAQTSWTLALADHVNRLQVVFGLVLACRDSEEVEQVMFPTMNTLPIGASLHGSGQRMLRDTQDIINGLRPFQHTSLRIIRSSCSDSVGNLDREKGLFDAIFIYQQRSGVYGSRTGPLYESVQASAVIDYPVAVEIEAIGEEIYCRAACKGSVMNKRQTERFLRNLDHIMETLVGAPHENVVEFTGSNRIAICRLPSFRLQMDEHLDVMASPETTSSSGDGVSFDSPLACAIRSTLSKVCQIAPEHILPHTSIESIGIDSISSIKVAGSFRKQRINLSVADIIRAHDVAGMVGLAAVNALSEDGEENSSSHIISSVMDKVNIDQLYHRERVDPHDVESIMPTTAGQTYMLSMWLKSRGTLFYPTFSYRLRTGRSYEDILAAWDTTIARNQLLRTVFFATGDPALPLLQMVLKESVRDPSSSRQPLVSIDLQTCGEGFDLKLSIHHALYDAVALPSIMHEMQARLEGAHSAEPDPHADGGFADFVALAYNPTAKAAAKAFWTQYLAETSNNSEIFKVTSVVQRRTESFTPKYFEGCQALDTLARANGVTVQALLFGVYAKSHATYTLAAGEHRKEARHDQIINHVVLGIYLSNRGLLPGLDELAAPTLNLVPLLVRSPLQAGLIDLAKQIHNDLRQIGSPQNSVVSLCEVEQWTGIKIDTFINILRLPGHGQRKTDESVHAIEMVEDNRLEARSRVEEASDRTGFFKMPKELEAFDVPSAYQHAIDVEMTMADNNMLSLGLFAPEEMLSVKEAERRAQGMRSMLEEVVAEV